MTKRPPIRALLIDISGNLHIGPKPTPRAIETLQRLRTAGIPFRLCSNLSKEGTGDLVDRLRALGFNIDFAPGKDTGKKEVWTSIGSVARLTRELGVKRPYVLLSPSARSEVLDEAGISSEDQSPDGEYDSVVVGLAPSQFDYQHLNTAFRILTGEHKPSQPSSHSNQTGIPTYPPPLIATHKAKYLQGTSPPGLSLGPGPFVTALEYATGREAHVVGKPTKKFFELVIGDLNNFELKNTQSDDYGKIVIIGDDIEADLGGGAVELGLWRVLVKTGKYREGDEARAKCVPPDEVHECFADFVDDLVRPSMGLN